VTRCTSQKHKDYKYNDNNCGVVFNNSTALRRASNMDHDDQVEPQEKKRRGGLLSGKDEMNLAEFPFASLRKQGDDRETIVYEGWATDEQGRRYQQKWIVRGLAEIGLPTEYDERVFVALMAVTATQGFESRKVSFSMYQILKIMGVGDRQKDYENLERALERLVGVTISSKDSFWDNEKKKRITTATAFHIIDKFWLRHRELDEEVREEEGVAAYITWGEDIWRSFQAGYLKSLDLQFFYSLESPLARRLYRFLDKRMQYRDQYEIDIFELSNRLGMVRYRWPADVKAKLQPAFHELMATGFLLSAEVVKVSSYTRVHFVRAPREAPDLALGSLPPELPARPVRASRSRREPAGALPAPRLPAPDESAAEPASQPTRPLPGAQADDPAALLIGLGLSPQIAQRLARRYRAEHLLEKIDYLAFLQATQPQQVKNPRGWLRRAIEEDYGPPDGYRHGHGREAATPDTPARHEALRQGESSAWRVPVLTWQEWVVQSHGLDPDLITLTEQAQALLKFQMPESIYQARAAQLLILEVGETQVRLAVPSAVSAAWIANRLNRLFEQVLAQLLGQRVTIELAVIEQPMPDPGTP
jgi:hypothetical protein